jgi:hypothetical protein
MMRSALTFSAAILMAFSASAAITVDYENKDSKEYKWEAVCSGSKTSGVTFKRGTTSAASIQGSAPCTVKTEGGDVVLKGGEKIEIKDGKIVIKK